ncbi:hypothetical protein B5S30_g2598 [[Candida] boidinii]|nr:hypothetical protein B5S30_g2598 [[Candida] boidinii]
MNKLSVASFNSRITSSIYEPRNPRNSTSSYKNRDFVLESVDKQESRLNPNLIPPTDFVQYNPYSQSLWYYCRGDEWVKAAELTKKSNLTDVSRSGSINTTYYKNPETVSQLVDNLLINEQKYCISLKLNDFLMETFIEFLQENSIQMRIKDIFKLFGNSKTIFQISDLFIDKLTLFKQNNFKSFDHYGSIEKILLSYLQRKLHTYPIELSIHKDKIEFFCKFIEQNSLFKEWLDFANNKIVANTDYKDFNQFLNIYLFELENVRDILKTENLSDSWEECLNIIYKLILKVEKPKDINKIEFYQPIKYISYQTLSRNLNSFQLNNHILNITKNKINELQKIQNYMIQSIREIQIYCNNNIKFSNLLILMKTSFQGKDSNNYTKDSNNNNNTRKRASYESINLNTPISLKFRNSFVNSSYELYREKASLQLDKSAEIFQYFQKTQMKVQSIKEAALQIITSVKSHQMHHEIHSENSIIKFYNCTDNNWKLSQCLLYLDQSLTILVKEYIISLNEFYRIISYSDKISNYAEIIQNFYESRSANKKLSIESNEGTFEENLGLTKVVKKLYR